jgi:fructose-bisphosphate aldolase, class I
MKESLEEIAQAMVAEGKGILAADESTSTIEKRLRSVGVESNERNRRDYRAMLLRSDEAMRNISGVILFDETLRQKAADGTPLVKIIEASGAIPGIKVDQGAKPMALHPGETVTEGLDGLRQRLAEYRELGARFAKWRAVIDIAESIPTLACTEANAHALARYAALCQEAGLVPIVEPEVLMDGPKATHDAQRCDKVTRRTLQMVFAQLFAAGVQLEGIVLKPNMIVAGKNAPKKASPQEVAERTVRCLAACVPPAVPGIAFLSGGQSAQEATQHLSLMNEMGPHPWKLTFSYGRALQAAALDAWRGKAENVPAAQRAFAHRAHMNGLAACGRWRADLEAR